MNSETILIATPQIRQEARMVLRILAGQDRPLIFKTGRYWSAWDGRGRIRPHRTWRGALRSIIPTDSESETQK